MKYFIVTVIVITGLFSGRLNLGYMMNQKYVCVNIGAFLNGKLVQVVSRDDALRHPMRIMVDSNNNLQTDGILKNLKYVGKNTYSDGINKIMLFVDNDKRYMFMSSQKVKNIPMVYSCTETDNWTIVK